MRFKRFPRKLFVLRCCASSMHAGSDLLRAAAPKIGKQIRLLCQVDAPCPGLITTIEDLLSKLCQIMHREQNFANRELLHAEIRQDAGRQRSSCPSRPLFDRILCRAVGESTKAPTKKWVALKSRENILLASQTPSSFNFCSSALLFDLTQNPLCYAPCANLNCKLISYLSISTTL